jgi:hypothetical protein
MPTRTVGMKNVPAVAQSLLLEEATVLTAHDVEAAAKELLDVRAGTTKAGWDWVPPRYFIG